MDPYVITVVLILTFLFIILSLAPILDCMQDADPRDIPAQAKTKPIS